MESTLATHTLVNTEMETLNDVFHELWPLKSAFPTLVKAIQIALTNVLAQRSVKGLSLH